MGADTIPPFLRLPVEIRLIIYRFLLDDGGRRELDIRHKIINHCCNQHDRNCVLETYRRTSYFAQQTTGLAFRCNYYKTTYALASGEPMRTAFMAVNRQIHTESTYLLYGRHAFNFDGDFEAVTSFFGDLTPRSRSLVQGVCLRKRSPLRLAHNECVDWLRACSYLAELPNLRRVRLIIEGGQPPAYVLGDLQLRRLEVSDLRLLKDIQQRSVTWLESLKSFTKLEALEICAELKHMTKPESSDALQYAMFSLSIETTLADFLREDYQLPVVVARGGQPASQ